MRHRVRPLKLGPKCQAYPMNCCDEFDPCLLPVDSAEDNALEVTDEGLFVPYSSVVGPPGPPGKDGQIRFTGHGQPGVIVGANPGDTYLDLDTGDIYKLT